MHMSSLRLVVFRLYLLTFGRFPIGGRILRCMLLKALRRKGKMTYVAHADFLDLRDFLGLDDNVVSLWRDSSVQEEEVGMLEISGGHSSCDQDMD